MSTFQRETKNPKTGKWEIATWHDDLFGNHRYGVIFPSDEKALKRFIGTEEWGYHAQQVAFNPKRIELETRPWKD